MNTAIKLSLFYPFLIVSQLTFAQQQADEGTTHKGSTSNQYFTKVKSTLFSKPYSQLPYYKVKAKRFGPSKPKQSNLLYNAAVRTLESNQDWLTKASEPKLFNANGICFAGSWNIEHESSYTGLFAKGTQIDLLARASVVLSGTLSKHKRAFGLALKLFPPDSQMTYNLVTANSLGGKRTKHVLDLPVDNEPELKGLPPISQVGKLLRINKDLLAADKEKGALTKRVNYRSVAHLAEYKTLVSDGVSIRQETSEKEIKAPTWLRFTPKTTQRINENDFRDELDISHYTEKRIVYTIEAADGEFGKKKKAQWQQLGYIQFDQSVSSRACDINLHFQHAGPDDKVESNALN